jgi:type II secretory pathway component PulJ
MLLWNNRGSNFMKKLINNKNGSSLVEVVVAIAMFSIVATAIVAVLFSSRTVTDQNMDMRINYENTVGRMDRKLEAGTETTTAAPAGGSGDSGSSDVSSDVEVSVKFPTDSSAVSVSSVKTVDGKYNGVGIVKAK